MNILLFGAAYRLLKRFCKDVVWDIFIGKTVDAIYKLNPKIIFKSKKKNYRSIILYFAVAALLISAPFFLCDVNPIKPVSKNHSLAHLHNLSPCILCDSICRDNSSLIT